jgi:hypothetical protein
MYLKAFLRHQFLRMPNHLTNDVGSRFTRQANGFRLNAIRRIGLISDLKHGTVRNSE